MIIKITKEDLKTLDNCFLQITDIENELNNNPFGRYLLYIQDNEVIGYLYYSDIYERVEINQIEVKPIHRNCGIGTKLIKNLIETVEKNITLEVKINNYPAIKLYKKFNFEKCAIRKGYYQGTDAILMERKI